MMTLRPNQIKAIIVEAVGSYKRYEDSALRVRNRMTGYHSPCMTNTRERIVVALWLRGMKQIEIAQVMGYRSSGTVSKMLKRVGMKA